MCLTGGEKHSLFRVLCLSVPKEEDLVCAFSESMHSSSRLGFSGAFWGGGSSPRAAKIAGVRIGGLPERGSSLTCTPRCVVSSRNRSFALLF